MFILGAIFIRFNYVDEKVHHSHPPSGEGFSDKRMQTNRKLFGGEPRRVVHARQGNHKKLRLLCGSRDRPTPAYATFSIRQFHQYIFVRININCNSCDCNGIFEPFVNANGGGQSAFRSAKKRNRRLNKAQ